MRKPALSGQTGPSLFSDGWKNGLHTTVMPDVACFPLVIQTTSRVTVRNPLQRALATSAMPDGWSEQFPDSTCERPLAPCPHASARVPKLVACHHVQPARPRRHQWQFPGLNSVVFQGPDPSRSRRRAARSRILSPCDQLQCLRPQEHLVGAGLSLLPTRDPLSLLLPAGTPVLDASSFSLPSHPRFS